jgi:hypothetical protein
LELTVNAIWKGLRKLNHRLDVILPTLVTQSDCARRHPGVERVLKMILLVVAVLTVGWGAWKFAIANERNETLAQEFRAAWPAAHAARKVIQVPQLFPVNVPDADEPKPPPARAPVKKAKRP